MKNKLICSMLVAVMCFGEVVSMNAATVSDNEIEVNETVETEDEVEQNQEVAETDEIAAESAIPMIQGVASEIRTSEVAEYPLEFMGTAKAEMKIAVYKAGHKEGDDPETIKTVNFDNAGKVSFKLDLSVCKAGDYKIVYYYTNDKASAQTLPLYIRKSIDVEKNKKITKLVADDIVYTGKDITPVVTIEETVDGKVYKLVKDKDYKVTLISDNKSKYGDVTVEIEGIGAYTGTIKKSFCIVPAAPTVTAVECLGYKSAKITWTKVAGVGGYEVERKAGTGNFEKVATVKGDATLTYTDSNGSLKTGETYYYRVKAIKTSETNPKETLTSKVSSEAGVSVKLLPNAPKIDSIESTSYNKLKLTWKPVEGASGYTIYQVLDNGNLKAVKSLTGTSYTIQKDLTTKKKLVCGKTYKYTVKAFATDPVSEEKIYSNDAAIVSAKAKPATPKLVSAKADSNNRVTIKWKEVSGAYGYYVYRKEANNEDAQWKKIKTVKFGDTTSVVDKKAVAGNTYQYSVKAYTKVNGKKIAGDMNQKGKKVTILPPKTAITVKQVGTTVEVKIANAAGSDGYYVYRSLNNGSYTNIGRIDAAKGDFTTYVDKSIASGAVHEYYVIPYVEGESKRVKGKKSDSAKIVVK